MSTETTPAIVRAERALVEKWHGTIGAAFHPMRLEEARAALDAALDVEEMAKVINEALMGYAPGTFDGVENGAWNARNDEIDVAKVAARLRTSILGTTS